MDNKTIKGLLPFGETRRQMEDMPVWEEAPKIVKPILRIDEKPAHWYETALYAWQHSLVNISPFVLPLVVAAAIGAGPAESAVWVNRGLFTMAIATFIQTIFGNRLPIVQGPSAIMTASSASVGAMMGGAAMWGAIFLASITQTLIGLLGLPGILRKMFPVTVSGIIIISIGFALGRLAVTWTIGDGSTINWVLAALVILSIAILQTMGGKIHPLLSREAIAFSVFAVGIVLSSVIGAVNWDLVANAPWFAVPELFPHGGPGFGWEFAAIAFFGIMIGIVGSIGESLGDYAAICAICDEKYKVRHMNRGVWSEGIACVIASLFGGIPLTSYSQSVGIIASTRIASRYVVQWCAVIMGLYALSPKTGAFMVAMPRSVIGAVFLVVSASIAMSGIRLISSIKLTNANAFVVGFTLLAAVLVPPHLNSPAMVAFRDSLPALVRLVATDTALLAVVLGILINQLVNGLFRGDNEEKDMEKEIE
jgi:xanthine/uracil permease